MNFCHLTPQIQIEGNTVDSDLFNTLLNTASLTRAEALETYKFVTTKEFADKFGDWQMGIGTVKLNSQNQPQVFKSSETGEYVFSNGESVYPVKNILSSKKISGRLSKLHEIVTSTVATLEKREKLYKEAVTKDTEFAPKQSRINQLSKTIESAKGLLAENKHLEAFIVFLDNAKNDLQLINDYLEKEDLNEKDNTFIQNVLQFRDYIQASGLLVIPDLAYGKSGIKDTMDDILRLRQNIQTIIPEKVNNHVKELLKTYNGNTAVLQDVEELGELFKTTDDIGSGDTWLENIESNKDVILNLVGRIYKDNQQKILDNYDNFESVANAAYKKLKDAGVKSFDFMLDTSAGYIKRIGDRYNAALKTLLDKTKDDKGNKLEYFDVRDLENAPQYKLEHNKKLQKIKEEFKNFKSAENVNYATGQPVDGENHKYTDAFKAVRNQFEELEKVDGIYKWVKKDGISEQDYNLYLRRFYQDSKVTTVAVKSKIDESQYVHMGLTAEITIRPVKNEFVEVKSEWNDDQYDNLMNDNSTQGVAKKEYYKFWVGAFEDGLLSKIPADIKKQMIGRRPVVEAAFTEKMTKNKGFFNVISKSLRKSFDPVEWSKTRFSDGYNLEGRDIPLFFVGSLKNQETINKLEEEIALLNSVDKNYKKDLEGLTLQLNKEKSKITANDVSTDLHDSILKFAAMAENYEVMKQSEASIKAIGEMLNSRTYKKNEKLSVEASKSNTVKRYESWLNLVYYQDSDIDKSTIGTISKKLMNYNSLQAIGLNIPSAVNNYLMGKIFQRIEYIGGQFFSKPSYNRASKEFKMNLGNMITQLGNHTKAKKYEDVKPLSKMEAMIKEFRFIQHQASVDGRVADHGWTDWAYALHEGGEYANQSKVGLAMIMDYKLGDSNLYDAYDFDKITSKLSLKPGYKITEEEKSKLTNKIKHTNSYIHGNYNAADKVAIQQHWLGEMGLQFHKWVYKFFKARFGNNYYDHGLEVEIEGRYRSLLTYFKHMKQFGFNLKANYNKMTPTEQANMKKNAAELVFFMTSIMLIELFHALGDGLDDDDETTKKLINFFAIRSSQIADEVSLGLNPMAMNHLVKNIIPLSKTFSEVAQVFGAGLKVPYNVVTGESEANYYDRGVNKDRLKLFKEAGDVLPLIKLINQWNQLEQQENFFIK